MSRMFNDKLAYAIARGEEVDDAWVNKYEDRVTRVKIRGDGRPDLSSSSTAANVDSSKIGGNALFRCRSSKIGNRMTIASMGLQ